MSNEKISISRIGPFGLSYCTAGAGATAAGSIWGAIGASGVVTPGIAATVVGAAAGGFAGSFSGALMNGASFGAAFKAGLKSAAISAATAYASHGIGGYFNEAKAGKGIWANDYANWGGRTLAHATVGGVTSELEGGEFRHGFLSSAASNGIMHIGGVQSFMSGDAGGWYVAGRTAVAALIGGTAAELSGGKFSNGAWTSALQHLFNAEATKKTLREAKTVHRRIIVDSRYNSEDGEYLWKQDSKALTSEMKTKEVTFTSEYLVVTNMEDLERLTKMPIEKGMYRYDIIIGHGGVDFDGAGYVEIGGKTFNDSYIMKLYPNGNAAVEHCLGPNGVITKYNADYANNFRELWGSKFYWEKQTSGVMGYKFARRK
jgi:hypothetical protein